MTSFRKTYFPDAGVRDWNDWRWQLRNSIRTRARIERFLDLTDEERKALDVPGGRLPMRITPYYMGLLLDSRALRRTVVPTVSEFRHERGEYEDSLGEDAHMPVSGLVHTYPDKVLFLVADQCAVYCRYCTRGRLAGSGVLSANRTRWKQVVDYIRRRPEIRDVLISGGEPLLLSEDKLEWLLKQLRDIPHVEIIRISTKVPAVLPQRITSGLTRMLKKYHPLWFSVHFTHPDELTIETERACARLANAGIPLCSQTVLLKGVNDDPATMKQLMTGLLRLRVKPYYLHQCDAVFGASHFRTTVEKGKELVQSLHGYTTGYAVPHFMLDAPGGGGKVPVSPDYVLGREGEYLILRNYKGERHRYLDAETWQAGREKGL